MRKFLFLLLLACITIIFYFSWLPNPDFGTENYLPLWLRNWSNCYYNLRTAVPFVAVGYLLEMRIPKNNPRTKIPNRIRRFIQNIGIAAAVVCIAEGGQFFITNRHPDFMDVVFGILGSICGVFFHHLFQVINNKFFNKNA